MTDSQCGVQDVTGEQWRGLRKEDVAHVGLHGRHWRGRMKIYRTGLGKRGSNALVRSWLAKNPLTKGKGYLGVR